MGAKNKAIALSIALLAIIVAGVYFIIKDNDNEDPANKFSEKTTDIETVEASNKTEKYYYVEQFLDEKAWDNFYNLFKYDDKIVKLVEGKNGEKSYLKDFKSNEKLYEISNNDIISGAGYWIYQNEFWNVRYDAESESVIVRSYDSNEEVKDKIELKGFKGVIEDNSYIQIEEMRVTEDYIYLLTRTYTMPMLQIFTKEGELINSFENVYSFDVNNRNQYIFSTVGFENFPYQGLFMIDVETGNEIFRNTSYILEHIRFSMDEKFIYGFEEKIHVFDVNNGTFIKSVFEFGIDSTYLLDDIECRDFMVGEDEELYFSLVNSMEENLSDWKHLYYLYTKKEGERNARETTLTITAPYRNDFMDEAIKRYELKYPNEKIEYNYEYNTYNAFRDNSEEYGTKMSLNIISGDIGDIVQIGGSGLDYQNLLRTDVFMDLTELIKEDKTYQYLNKSALNAIKINNSLKALPVNIVISQYELNEDLEKELKLNVDFNSMSWSELLDIVKIIEDIAPDKHLFADSNTNAWEVFGDELVNANLPDLISLETKTVKLNQEWFKELLIKFKKYSSSKNFINSDWEYDLYDNLHGSLLTLKLSRDQFYGDTLSYYDEYNKTNKSSMIPIFTGEKNNNRIGYSIRMYSIKNRSDRKENAWKFLSFLLEEDIQFNLSREKSGLPINQKGIDRMIKDAIDMHRLSGENIDKYNKALMENLHNIDYLYNMGLIRVDIHDSIALYMNGSISLDEAIKKAEEKVTIRLNE